MKKGGRYGKYGEQKRRERLKTRRVTEAPFRTRANPMERLKKKGGS